MENVVKKTAYKGMSEAKELGDYVEKISKKFYDKRNGSKIKGKLGSKRVSKIPGYSYWFEK